MTGSARFVSDVAAASASVSRQTIGAREHGRRRCTERAARNSEVRMSMSPSQAPRRWPPRSRGRITSEARRGRARAGVGADAYAPQLAGGAVGAMALSVAAPGGQHRSAPAREGRPHALVEKTSVAGPPSISPGRTG